tara:strand:- start:532 stop:699 length:168 start_codon:yes stop_codon:yes gene_type:complete
MVSSEVMVQVVEELADIEGMDLQETNIRKRSLLVHHILEIQVVKDGNQDDFKKNS